MGAVLLGVGLLPIFLLETVASQTALFNQLLIWYRSQYGHDVIQRALPGLDKRRIGWGKGASFFFRI